MFSQESVRLNNNKIERKESRMPRLPRPIIPADTKKRATFWFDTETTGVDPDTCAVIQLGALIEIGGVIREEINVRMRPFFGAEIHTQALTVNKTTRDQIENYPPWEEGFEAMEVALRKYVSPYDPNDKYVIGGYNVDFDINFLRKYYDYYYGDKAYMKHKKFFGSWFFWPSIDVKHEVAKQVMCGHLRLQRYTLKMVCGHYGIPLDEGAHDAVNDIKATRNLYQKLMTKNRNVTTLYHGSNWDD